MYFGDSIPIPLETVYSRIITIRTGRIHARTTFPDALSYCAGGHFHPGAVTSRVVPFSQAAEAYFDPSPKIVFHNDWPH
jgi:threonine dehydrogenase-like Zn-dependent dehydrogenase